MEDDVKLEMNVENISDRESILEINIGKKIKTRYIFLTFIFAIFF